MEKRRTAEEVARLLRNVDHDLAKGLTVADTCHKIGIAETTYRRLRQRHDPATVDAERRCRGIEAEGERLKRLAAELMPDEPMQSGIAENTESLVRIRDPRRPRPPWGAASGSRCQRRRATSPSSLLS